MPFAGVKVLSEVDMRLMMMFGAGASTCAAKCGGAAFSRINEVATTTVPAGTSPASLGAPEILLSLKIRRPLLLGSIRTLFRPPRCNEG